MLGNEERDLFIDK